MKRDAEPLGRAETPEERDDGDGIRRGDERGEDEGGSPPELPGISSDAGRCDEQGSGRADGHHDPRNRERDDRARVGSEVGELQMIGGFEEKAGEEDCVEQILGEVDPDDESRRTEPESCQHQGHRVRNANEARRDGDRRRRGKEEDQRNLRGHTDRKAIAISETVLILRHSLVSARRDPSLRALSSVTTKAIAPFERFLRHGARGKPPTDESLHPRRPRPALFSWRSMARSERWGSSIARSSLARAMNAQRIVLFRAISSFHRTFPRRR